MIGLDDSPRAIPYDFINPMASYGGSIGPVFHDIIKTAAFQRLKDVRFLGGIDYLIVRSPNGSHNNVRFTRYQHSLGVARLALHYCDIVGANEASRALAVTSALLHDVGHAPLSHSLEPVFEKEFGINHHDVTKDIILGKSEYGKELNRVLLDHNVDPDQVSDILDRKDDSFCGFFSGPINFDTIEGVLRSRRYVKRGKSNCDPLDVVNAAILRSKPEHKNIIDRFWEYKDEVYCVVVRSPEGVVADYICQDIAKNNLHSLCAQDYFLTERSLFRRLPALRRALDDVRGHAFFTDSDGEISYNSRRFYIDYAGDFYARFDAERYRQTKHPRQLKIEYREKMQLASKLAGFFND